MHCHGTMSSNGAFSIGDTVVRIGRTELGPFGPLGVGMPGIIEGFLSQENVGTHFIPERAIVYFDGLSHPNVKSGCVYVPVSDLELRTAHGECVQSDAR